MLRDELTTALKTAMKARAEREVSTLRLILAALKDRDIAARGRGEGEGIGEDEIRQMLQSMIKQRRESIALYEQGGRLELAEREGEEIQIIERFLPRQLNAGETEAAIRAVIGELGASTIKDMGRTMAALRQRYLGQIDFAKAGAVVKKLLT